MSRRAFEQMVQHRSSLESTSQPMTFDEMLSDSAAACKMLKMASRCCGNSTHDGEEIRKAGVKLGRATFPVRSYRSNESLVPISSVSYGSASLRSLVKYAVQSHSCFAD